MSEPPSVGGYRAGVGVLAGPGDSEPAWERDMSEYARLFSRAAEIMGGERRLAEHLKASREELEQWSSGSAQPPAPVFLKLAEIIKQELMKGYGSKPAGAAVAFPIRRHTPQ